MPEILVTPREGDPMPTTEKETAVKGPSPTLILLTALKNAGDAGVEWSKVSTMLSMCIAAASASTVNGPRSLAPIFKNCSDTLNGYIAEVKAAEGVTQS